MNQEEINSVPWEEEIERRATRIHVVACQVAVIAVPAFAITDYIITPQKWEEFLMLRLIVAAIVGGVLILRKWINIWDTMLAFIPFVTISLLNAYMWSTMDVEAFQMHSFSYIALFLAGGMLLLWRAHYTKKVVALSFLFNIIAFWLFSHLSIPEIMSNGGALTAAVALFSVILMDNRYKATKEEIISRMLLERSKQEIEEKNKEIVASISYAKRIQDAMLPPQSLFQEYLPSSWVMYRPKDIVAGDFYWLEQRDGYVFLAVADCTGHGVPGAMVSVVCSNAFHRAVNELGLLEPAQILDSARETVLETFKKGQENVNDGMDVAFCRIDLAQRKVVYAGANNSFYHINPLIGEPEPKEIANESHKVVEYKGNKQPVGRFIRMSPFTQKEIQLAKGDHFYMTTDGFPDQFGGPKGKKYLNKPMKRLFLSLSGHDIKEQKSIVNEEFINWLGKYNQIDDVCMIGVRV